MGGEAREKAQAFRALHRRGVPLILFNAWDAGSARIIAKAGARAIATGSWSAAAAQGFADGEAMPLGLVLANAERIVAAVDLPVSVDFERGYADDPGDLADTIAALVVTGAIGCNIEDGSRAAGDQAARIAAARRGAGRDFFINARTDLFLHSDPAMHGDLVPEALERGKAYADAGADGFFVPGLGDQTLIGRVCEASALPVNIMAWPDRTPAAAQLAELGVARISHAGGPWRIAMAALEAAAREAQETETK